MDGLRRISQLPSNLHLRNKLLLSLVSALALQASLPCRALLYPVLVLLAWEKHEEREDEVTCSLCPRAPPTSPSPRAESYSGLGQLLGPSVSNLHMRRL